MIRPQWFTILAVVVAGLTGCTVAAEVTSLRVGADDPCENCDSVSAVDYSPDGELAIAAYGRFIGLLQDPRPGEAIIWDLRSGKRRATLLGHKDGVSSAAFSPNGRVVATGSFDGTAKLWDVRSGRELLTLAVPEAAVVCVAFAPNGAMIATGLWAGQSKVGHDVKLWDTSSGKQLASLSGHADAVSAVAFAQDGKQLASGSMDGSARLWDLKTNGLVASIPLADAQGDSFIAVNSVAISPDGATLTVGGAYAANFDGDPDGALKFWDIPMEKVLSTLHVPSHQVKQVAYSKDGALLIVATDEMVKVLDAKSKKEVAARAGSRPFAASPTKRQMIFNAGNAELKISEIEEVGAGNRN